ncbi:MAG: YggT family protein [Actinomycetota bacterium]
MAGVLITLLNLYTFVLLARAISSWFPIGFDSPFRPVVDFLYRVTEPVLAPIRRLLPPLGGFDLSFLVVIFGIRLLLIPLINTILP